MRGADIDIGIAIVIDIGYADPRTPSCRLQTRRRRDIFEPEISLVDIQPAADHTPAKEQVGQAILIKIAYPDPRTIVHIFVDEHIHRIAFRDRIAEANMGLPRIHFGKMQPVSNGLLVPATE
jgi:hypothetical protein